MKLKEIIVERISNYKARTPQGFHVRLGFALKN
ncbi:hypothetical protein EV213_11442 [Aureibacillus halotolerans]|uniref:Uncharacterized protein n=1 Tax=Aureibacillus halotolerans TaxID=1508390 RepID=A0A4R6TXR8_9BACI|nr:hypothetical protein EV213_11442 [Aureibacillus halotolerans]